MAQDIGVWVSLLLLVGGCGAPAGSGALGAASFSNAGEPAGRARGKDEVAVITLAAPPGGSADEGARDPEAGMAVAAPDAGDGFRMFHGDVGRTGFADAPSVTAPVVIWRSKVGIQGWLNAPVLAGSLVLVPTSGTTHNAPDAKDGVAALALSDGSEVWRAKFEKDANGAAVLDNRVFATSDDGHVYALDLQTGKVLWKQRGRGKMYSTPLPLKDRVIVGDSGGTLRALSAETGAPLWQAQLNGAIRGGASADGERVYAVSQGGEAIALRHDGKVVWRRPVTRPGFGGGPAERIEAYAPPLITARSMVVPFARDTSYDTPALLSLDKATGSLLWEAQGQAGMDWGNVRTTPALTSSGVLVYAEPYSGDVAGIDVNDGSFRFRRTLGPCFFPQWASAVATADRVYVPRFDGALYAIKPDDGRPVWQLYLGEERRLSNALPSAHRSGGCSWEVPSGSALFSPPAIAANGTIIIGSGEGFVFAIADATRR
jgi:outer membrane protein assembly factor BamB